MRWPADLDPRDLKQPDPQSCGAASALAAKALLTGWRPTDADAEIRTEHRILTSAVSPRDRFQMPWPRALGTPPWALVNTMRQLTGRHIATVLARPRPAIAYDVLREELGTDRPVGVYIGNRWLPRHVILAVGATEDGVQVFDPARGTLIDVPERDWVQHRIGVAGWTHFWAVV